MSAIPKPLSLGEETLALHLRANHLSYEREVRMVSGRNWRVDFLLRQHNLVVEVEGGIWRQGRHSRGSGMESDMQKYNALVICGFSVLRYSTEMVERGDAIRDILSFVSGARAHLNEVEGVPV